jgi:uncharacterized RDD family membrane protein YckC
MTQEKEHPDHDGPEVTVDTLRTPPLRIQPAPLQKRFASALIDSIIIGVIWFILISAAHLGLPQEAGLTSLSLAVITFLYYFLLEALAATTIGKHFLKLRVVGRAGDPVTFTEALVRNLLRFVDWLPLFYIVGLTLLLASKRRQRVGDLVAGTFVTPAPEKDINPPPAPFLFH